MEIEEFVKKEKDLLDKYMAESKERYPEISTAEYEDWCEFFDFWCENQRKFDL